MSDETQYSAPPEGRLIQQRRTAMLISPERLSQQMKEAGRRAVSGGRIREIEKGLTRSGAPTRAPAERLVELALALGITAAELDEADRGDAAELLREHVRQRSEQEPLIAALATSGETEISQAAHDVLQMIFQGLDEIRHHPLLSDSQKQELERSFLAQYRRSAESIANSLRDTLRVVTGESQE